MRSGALVIASGGGWSKKDTAHTLGMAAAALIALLVCLGPLVTGVLHGSGVGVGRFVGPAAVGLAAGGATAAVFVVVCRPLRADVARWWRGYWVYRRRWAAVLARLGLTMTANEVRMTRQDRITTRMITTERRQVPPIMSITCTPAEDVLRIALLPGQSPSLFQDRASALGTEFDAHSVYVGFADAVYGEIVLVFGRTPAASQPAHAGQRGQVDR